VAQLTSALKGSLRVIKRRLVPLWVAAAWPYIAMAICFLIFGFVIRAYHEPSPQADPITLWRSLSVLAKVGVLLAYVACISLPHGLATAGAVVVVWSDLQGEAVVLQSVFSRIRKVLPRLLVLSLCVGVMCSLFGMFFFVPGILGFAFLSFAIPVLMIEDTRVSTSLRKGIDLASSRTGAVLGLYAIVLVIIVAGLAILFVGAALVPSNVDFPWWVIPIAFWLVFVFMASALIMGTTTVIVHLYEDLCARTGPIAAIQP
jgi:hypothetical protein